MKTALITGVTGQDGSYVADILLERGYEVHGLYRRVAGGDNLLNVRHLLDNVEFHLHRGDVLEALAVDRLVRELQPDELYHFADQDNVDWSFKLPGLAADLTAGATAKLLESVVSGSPKTRVFVPTSATMFGDAQPPQDEGTPLRPLSPYAVGKVSAYHWAHYYREVRGLHVVVGIMFNHDSPRRRGDYLLHKIARAVATREPTKLRSATQRVDIGWALQFMMAVVDLMRLDKPETVVIGTGTAHMVSQMVDRAERMASFQLSRVVEFGLEERPGTVPTYQACPSKLLSLIGWHPTSTSLNVVSELVNHYRGTELGGPVEADPQRIKDAFAAAQAHWQACFRQKHDDSREG